MEKTATLPDPAKLQAFLGKVVHELGAAANGALMVLGDRLGLFEALASGAATPEELAAATGTDARLLREWLSTQAATGFVEYEPEGGRFSLSPEAAAAFADPEGPAAMIGGFVSIHSLWKDLERVEDAFRTGRGFAWGDHDACMFCGTERFFAPTYRSQLVQSWIPAVDGMAARLERGALVADVGCGHGVSTRLLAEAFPNSRVVGFDLHEASIEHARAHHAGVPNLSFEVASAQDFPGDGYDLVAFFDCLHDMGDPVGAARRVRSALAPDGAWMVVEPLAGDRLEDNLHPVGRVYYAFSSMACVPGAQSQPGGMSLGAQAGDARLFEIAKQGGFTSARRAAQTPFNVVIEARP